MTRQQTHSLQTDAAKHCYSFHMWPVCLHSFIGTVKMKMIINKTIIMFLGTVIFIIFNSNKSKSSLATNVFIYNFGWSQQRNLLSEALTYTTHVLMSDWHSSVSVSDFRAPWLLHMRDTTSLTHWFVSWCHHPLSVSEGTVKESLIASLLFSPLQIWEGFWVISLLFVCLGIKSHSQSLLLFSSSI